VSDYLELNFELGSLSTDAVEEIAGACGALAVTFMDAQDDPVLEPGVGEIRLWPRTLVRCLFAEQDPAVLRARLAACLALDPARLSVERLADRAWEREWLKDFHALRCGRRLWICPRHERVGAPDAVVVTLDPGLAFGTGTHPSTALCLEWLDARLDPGTAVIDYGCGSGILAIAAARLGAAEVHAFDIDPQALIATDDNARENGVSGRLTIHERAASLPQATDVLLANILAAPLCELAGRFATLLRPGGQLVLAGLMEHEAAEVTAAYRPCFDVTSFGYRDGWVCLAGRRH
jgi:ribosomal protein L11 methyltransferase